MINFIFRWYSIGLVGSVRCLNCLLLGSNFVGLLFEYSYINSVNFPCASSFVVVIFCLFVIFFWSHLLLVSYLLLFYLVVVIFYLNHLILVSYSVIFISCDGVIFCWSHLLMLSSSVGCHAVGGIFHCCRFLLVLSSAGIIYCCSLY